MSNKLLYSVLFIIVTCIFVGSFTLWKASKPENDVRKEAEAFALEKKALAVVEDSYTYNGNRSYVTVFGKDGEGEIKAVFVPTNFEADAVKEVYLKEGISKQQALSILASEGNVKEILHVKLGYEEAGAVWEITYKNQQDNLNYVYVLFKDGQWWKRILNL